ncbi:MAG TPA: hypothetical protein EYG38_02610 [Verrucomicrobia bacterium]|nr:hypothetical protein [Verrucomicrobiota bacterium]
MPFQAIRPSAVFGRRLQLENTERSVDVFFKRFDKDLKDVHAQLSNIGVKLPSDDPYRWILFVLQQNYQETYNVEFIDFDPPEPVAHPDLPGERYQMFSSKVRGSAWYHDFGNFLSAFENDYPYLKIFRLTIEPASVSMETQDPEKLAFEFEIRRPLLNAEAEEIN